MPLTGAQSTGSVGAAGLAAHDVVGARRLAKREFVEAGAVVQVAPANHAELLKGRQAAVDSDEIALADPPLPDECARC